MSFYKWLERAKEDSLFYKQYIDDETQFFTGKCKFCDAEEVFFSAPEIESIICWKCGKEVEKIDPEDISWDEKY